MKKNFFLLLACGIGIGVFAQVRPHFPKGVNKTFTARADDRVIDNDNIIIGSRIYNPIISVKSTLYDSSTAVTTYDCQTNRTDMNRIYRYPDGTIGVVCTWSASTIGTAFPDRGTGYNYFNGTAWGALPTGRIETSVRTGWPSYAPLGSNGEIVIAHNITGQTLVMSTRTTKGTGIWEVTQPAGLGPPSSGGSVMGWPRMVTNGNPRTNIHIIAMTSGTYAGMTSALLYNRSLDGGATWTGWQLLPGMTSSLYSGFSSDSYAWAEPKGDTLCFVVGASWMDEFIMKSTDNGNTWTKTKIWTCNWDLWSGTTATDTFYCPDDNNAIALDNNGKAHVVFGLQRAYGDNTGARIWFPFTDGLIYWNESMAELPQKLIPDTLFNHGNYIGWVTDTMVFYQAPTQLAYYYNSLSGFPTLVIDQNNWIFVIWSGVTTLLDLNNYMLRHLFARASVTGGVTWRDSIVEITSNYYQYHFEECVYPSASPTSTDSLFILFQGDIEAGAYVNANLGGQGQTDITNNDMFITKPAKSDILLFGVGIDQKKNQPTMMVSQNSPNPFKNQTQINVNLTKPGTLLLDVYSFIGQKVMEINDGTVNSGNYRFTLNSTQFSPGIYFYIVKNNNESSTHKMIVD